MAYQRPRASRRLNKEERTALLVEHFRYYSQVASQEPSLLNRKLPREAMTELLDEIGSLLLAASRKLAGQSGPVREFLDQNPLPKALEFLLPDDFRVFCLALNSLKQW